MSLFMINGLQDLMHFIKRAYLAGFTQWFILEVRKPNVIGNLIKNTTVETSVLWAFEEDILSRNWLDWLTAHTSFLKPLHRYEGVMTIFSDRLNFGGADKRTHKEVSLDIYKYQIEQLYLGFDEAFNAMETRSLGLTWLPLRLTFMQDTNEKKLYIITNYHLGWSDNKDYFEFLKNWTIN